MLKNKDVCVQWLRAYYIYGDDKRSNSIFAKIVTAEEKGKEFFPFTTGKNKYDFISVAMLAKQLAAFVMQTEVDGSRPHDQFVVVGIINFACYTCSSQSAIS